MLLRDFPPGQRCGIMVRAGISELTTKSISGNATDSVFDAYDIGDQADF